NDSVTKIMEQAQAIVVLLTPDDEAKLKKQFVNKHERQSEGKLRGHPDRRPGEGAHRACPRTQIVWRSGAVTARKQRKSRPATDCFPCRPYPVISPFMKFE